MRYVAAYLLLVLGGKSAPTSSDIEKLLSSAGVNVDQVKAQFVVDQMKGKTLEAVMAEGAAKLGALPAGGGGVSSGKAEKGEKVEAKPEPKEEEKKEDSGEGSDDDDDDDMGFGLFGDDDD